MNPFSKQLQSSNTKAPLSPRYTSRISRAQTLRRESPTRRQWARTMSPFVTNVQRPPPVPVCPKENVLTSFYLLIAYCSSLLAHLIHSTEPHPHVLCLESHPWKTPCPSCPNSFIVPAPSRQPNDEWLRLTQRITALLTYIDTDQRFGPAFIV